MSIRTVVTRGFGSFGTIPFVTRRGYSSAAASIEAICNVNFFGPLQDTLNLGSVMNATPSFGDQIKSTYSFDDEIKQTKNFKGDVS